ncbi:MAG: EAL domain-containing protein [Azoarcus sp.]|nr:EAL domain-containing protein [Azoarcus sp.]
MEPIVRIRRSRWLSLVSTVLTLGIAFVLLMVHQYVVGRQVLLEELHTEAAIIAENSSAALVFDDARSGKEIIAAIRHTPRIVAAALYRANGMLLAAESSGTRSFPSNLSGVDGEPAAGSVGVPDTTSFGASGGLLREDIHFNGAMIGTLVLEVDFTSLYRRLLEYAAGVVGIAVVALALAYRLTRRLRRRTARAEERLEHFALYDQVTGLPNRRLFEDELRKVVDHVRRQAVPAALLFLDVDDFKKVNDSFGHEVGDQVLAMVAERLRSTLRAGDVVGRIGGDEFAAVLYGVGDPDYTAHVVRKLIAAISVPFPTEPTPTHIGLSVGIAMLPADGEDPAALLRHADMAMYVAKGQGKNGYQFFSESIDGKVRHDLRLEADLRLALKEHDGGLWVAYQPKVCARTRRVVGVEALARWRTEDGGFVSPAEFIPVAEHTGLISELGDWVLDRVCRDLAELRATGVAVPKVAVNVSPLQLLRGDAIVGRASRTLARYGERATHFEFELTESALTEARGARVLEALRAAGFALAIDDFGTGYSSLGYLKRFQVSTLKIDQSFISGVPGDEENAAIVRAVVQMAHALNISVVAEGVETEVQAEFLAMAGCDILQGYLLGRPMAVNELATFLREPTAAVV